MKVLPFTSPPQRPHLLTFLPWWLGFYFGGWISSKAKMTSWITRNLVLTAPRLLTLEATLMLNFLLRKVNHGHYLSPFDHSFHDCVESTLPDKTRVVSWFCGPLPRLKSSFVVWRIEPGTSYTRQMCAVLLRQICMAPIKHFITFYLFIIHFMHAAVHMLLQENSLQGQSHLFYLSGSRNLSVLCCKCPYLLTRLLSSSYILWPNLHKVENIII